MPVDYLQKPIFRMVHFNNMEYLLQKGICAQNHKLADPNYIAIGDPILIPQRNTFEVKIPPGGNLGDYIPFYFGGHSPMLLNMKTGHRGIIKINQADIVFIVCSIENIVNDCSNRWCFTDGHAKNSITNFYNLVDDLDKIDWEIVMAQMWNNTDEDFDRMRRKQAEFLIKDYVSISCIKVLVVFNKQRKEQLEKIVQQLKLNIPVKVDTKKQLYY
ncbi:MAG: DUF4433 domain-containing protein [Bacteroidales bacterium]|jgi:hypothetical protein|nr:DUF4433 domain-containing protein [Bacteroidales bacterium]